MVDTLGGHLGRQLLHWAITQADIWYLAYRCAEIVTKFHEPLERGVAILDNILTLEEEETIIDDRYSNEQLYMDHMNVENYQNLVDNIENIRTGNDLLSFS